MANFLRKLTQGLKDFCETIPPIIIVIAVISLLLFIGIVINLIKSPRR